MNPLQQWLADATRGLSTDSAVQVHAEIQQHYDSACEAGDDAIAALGDPRAANRAYRKVLLTEQEAMLAPTFTQPKQPGVLRMVLTSVVVAAFAGVLSRRQHGPEFWLMAMAIYSSLPFVWFFPLTTLERCRKYTWVLGARSIVVAAIVWWYDGWMVALPLGAAFFLFDYFFNHQRLSIFRKLAAGQIYRLLPEEPRLTHVEAITLRMLGREPELPEKVSSAVLLMMVAGMAVWLPATFAPMAAWVFAAHFTRRAVPFCTEEGSRRFRIAKWTAMAIAALLPALLGARIPWSGAVFLAQLFWLFDMKGISIRRKLPVAQWPKRLYW